MISTKNTNNVAIKYYEDRTRNIGKLVGYFDAPSASNDKMQIVLNSLVQDDWACELKLYDDLMNLVAQSKSATVCLPDYGYTASTSEFTLTAYYFL